jgi:predicted RNA-binding Zn-ribbon protein involved in translation (DUF1610 family)
MEQQIEYVTLDTCPKCGCENFNEKSFNAIHGHYYRCEGCGYNGWGGRSSNKVKNEKRPPCPTPRDLSIDRCQNCLRPLDKLFYSEVLETHHIDNDAKNNDRINLLVLCTKCHKQTHHDRLYLYHHTMEVDNGDA